MQICSRSCSNNRPQKRYSAMPTPCENTDTINPQLATAENAEMRDWSGLQGRVTGIQYGLSFRGIRPAVCTVRVALHPGRASRLP
jgi:hypothetical protein